ncbi:MAG: alpha/beta hydrolase-fold protein [Gaiellaceae bacterium]
MCALALPAALPGSAHGSRTVIRAFYSHRLAGPLHFQVSLPAGYASTNRRYPVIYFLHGLPAAPDTYRGSLRWLEAALARTGREAIIVQPQGARDGDGDSEYLDWGGGRNWQSAIAEGLPEYVDSHFRTIPDRRARALIGLSAGGYGATIAALRHLGEFSVVESWSGYFHPTDPSGLRALDLGSPRANARASAHTYVSRLHSAFRARPTLFAFYVGVSDQRFLAENVRLHEELKSARVPHVFAVYRGGHERTLWSKHAAAWLRLATERLTRAR